MNFKESILEKRGPVPFPENTLQRLYMFPFMKGDLPDSLEVWKPTVDAMLEGIDSGREMYLMIHQKHVRAFTSHRNPGLHIDGHWDQCLGAHRIPNPSPRHRMPSENSYPEAILLASDVKGCRAFLGKYGEEPDENGDLSHMDTYGMTPVYMEPGFVYAGNIHMVHESLPMGEDTLRTLVRINVPGRSPIETRV